ncbi:MAG: sulfatase-like hydrolase/transferase [Kiritimatiellae bacterium]|nr:sulfatase-like hydrolase/transferase [Kiritimatiellia bacterium]
MPSRKPNIVFLQSDQYRHDALGRVRPWMLTPNLDALARRGILFRQATCTVPMCIPSRYSMMLGLYGSQSGVRHNSQMIPTDTELPVPTLAQRLQALGYRTGGFGKTHWYSDLPVKHKGVSIAPSRRGFDCRALACSPTSASAEPEARYYPLEKADAARLLDAETAAMGSGENAAGYRGLTSRVPGADHPEAWLTDQAVSFVGECAKREEPFFLYLSFDAPHPGLVVPPGYEDRYRLDDIPVPAVVERGAGAWEHLEMLAHTAGWADTWRQLDNTTRLECLRRYYALCTYVDEQLGRAIAAAQDAGVLDETLFVFTSDHGESLGDRGRFSKYSLYESSVRVPLILAGPGVPERRKNTLDDLPASLIDIVPTLLSAAGAQRPHSLPGANLLSDRRRTGSFAEMHGVGCERRQRAPAYMWRTPRHKLILSVPVPLHETLRDSDGVCGELYDLAEDPGETHNLYSLECSLPLRERLTRDLLCHLAAVWARYPARPGLPDP